MDLKLALKQPIFRWLPKHLNHIAENTVIRKRNIYNMLLGFAYSIVCLTDFSKAYHTVVIASIDNEYAERERQKIFQIASRIRVQTEGSGSNPLMTVSPPLREGQGDGEKCFNYRLLFLPLP